MRSRQYVNVFTVLWNCSELLRSTSSEIVNWNELFFNEQINMTIKFMSDKIALKSISLMSLSTAIFEHSTANSQPTNRSNPTAFNAS